MREQFTVGKYYTWHPMTEQFDEFDTREEALQDANSEWPRDNREPVTVFVVTDYVEHP